MLNHSRKKSAKIIILSVLLAAQILFIISNSMRSAETSDNQSGFFVRFAITKILRLDYNKQSEAFVDSVTHFVRKTAHFTEFAVLAGIVFLLLYVIGKNRFICFTGASATAFFVGGVDELVQLYSPGRACRFTDVLIDTSGGIFASFILFLLFCYVQKQQKRYMRGTNEQI